MLKLHKLYNAIQTVAWFFFIKKKLIEISECNYSFTGMKIIVSCGENFYDNHSQENIDFITLYGYEAKFFNGLIYTLFTKRMLCS